jgi:ribulose-phosphate 3-epimerase
MTQISPSVLACDFANIQRDVEMINATEASYFHIDIMDGVFVPNISFGFPVLEAIFKHAKKPMDVHLMIIEPEKYFVELKRCGAEIITVHYEACPHLHSTIQQIKALGLKAGVALNPHTSVSLLENVIADLDLVLIMSVNPGYGGQKFLPLAVEKVAQTKKLLETKNHNCIIEVDGGVNQETGKLLVDAGATLLVAGSYVFSSANPSQTIAEMCSL